MKRFTLLNMLIALLSAMAFAQKDINLRHLNEGTEPIYVKGDEWASYFTFSSAEGIELRFSVISGPDMSCRLVSVPKGASGRVTVPALAGEYVVREVGDSAFLGHGFLFVHVYIDCCQMVFPCHHALRHR